MSSRFNPYKMKTENRRASPSLSEQSTEPLLIYQNGGPAMQFATYSPNSEQLREEFINGNRAISSFGGFKEIFNSLNDNVRVYTKLEELEMNRPYIISSLEKKTTRYGQAVVAELNDLGRSLRVFLPRRFNLSDGQIEEFNNENEEVVSLIYLGKIGLRHEIRFT